jgi:hypothetical protein
MRTKFTALIFASLVGVGAMLVMPTQASAFAVPAAQREAVNQSLGTGGESLYQEARHRRWHKRHRHRHGWRHRRHWHGDYGYYHPRRRYWRRYRHWDDYPYYGYGYGGPGIYFGFGL